MLLKLQPMVVQQTAPGHNTVRRNDRGPLALLEGYTTFTEAIDDLFTEHP
jgi:hypothetical protein